MKDRLSELMRAEGLSSSKLAEILDVQPSNISHIMSGRNKPGFDFIEKLLLRFHAINPEWIILGQGEMYRKNIMPAPTENPQRKDTRQQPAPDQDGDAVEKIIVFYSDNSFKEYLPK